MKDRVWAEQTIRDVIRHIGEDPDREGLRETPKRVVDAMAELYSGYKVDVDLLFKTFASSHDEMVVLRDIPFTSMCEHHMLPFCGVAHVGYIPLRGKIVGISKLARVVDAYARRLQVQEQLTHDVVDAIYRNLKPLGAGVVIEAQHLCMSCRGVSKSGSTMTTSKVIGVFRDTPVRAEFMSLIGK